MSKNDLKKLAAMHHDVLTVICRHHNAISKKFASIVKQGKSAHAETLFVFLSQLKDEKAETRELAKNAAMFVRTLENLKKPLDGKHAKAVSNLSVALTNLSNPKEQLAFLKKIDADKNSSNVYPDNLDLAIVIAETGLNSVYDETEMTNLINSNSNGLSGFKFSKTHVKDLLAMDAVGTTLYADPSDLLIPFMPSPHASFGGLLYPSIIAASVMSAAELTSKLVDVIHGPNDPNGPIWWPTPGGGPPPNS